MPGMTTWVAILLAKAAAPAALPEWLAGCWIDERGEAWTEECWTAPRAGTMLGAGRNGRGERLLGWEVMQIMAEPDGKPAFWGAPRGAGRTRFATASSGTSEIVFVNAAHDYPQRIRYWREGAVLHAETSLIDGGKPMRWTYRRHP